MRSNVACVWVLAALIGSCNDVSEPGGSGPLTGCAPAGITRVCTCPDGRMSEQVCQADRTFAACLCDVDAGFAPTDTGVVEDTGVGFADAAEAPMDALPIDTGEPENRPPVIANLAVSRTQLTEHETVTFTAVVTDPDDGVATGVLRSAAGAVYGSFTQDVDTFTLELSWSQIHVADPIDFALEDQRELFADFFDVGGGLVTGSLQLRLHCNDEGACDGACATLMSDRTNCGACGTVCPANRDCCTGRCSDPLTDSANCGMCGSVCTSSGAVDRVCSSGACVARCPATCDSQRGNSDCRLCPGRTRCVVDMYGGGGRFGTCGR